MEHLKKVIREIPDFPKPGILFYDITTLLADGPSFAETVRRIVDQYRDARIETVIGIEARGFIFAAAVACALGAGFVPVRKPGKLPWKTVSRSYALEYGTDTLEMHEDAVTPGRRVLLVDDLIATGGTARAVKEMVQSKAGELVGACFVVELDGLKGREKMDGTPVFSLLHYEY